MATKQQRKSIKKLLISETATVVFIWLILLLTFSAFQISLYRYTQMGELEKHLQNVAKGQESRLTSFLSLNEEASATQYVVRSLKAKHNLDQASLSQSFFTHWPQPGCELLDADTEACQDFFSGQVKIRQQLKIDNQIWFLQFEKTLNRPWGSQGWWAASLMAFGTTMFILGILFLRLIFVLRSEVMLPVQEAIDVLGFTKSERSWWLKKQGSSEVSVLAKKLFAQQDLLKKKSVLAEVGKLSTQVAHDIRGPLSLLQVLTDIQRKSMSEDELLLARQAVQRIDQIAEDLLCHRNRLQEKAPKRYEVSWLINEVSKILNEKRRDPRARQIQLRLILDKELNESAVLNAEALGLIRVIENLIKNAMESCSDRSARASLSLQFKTKDDELCIDVLDTGLGMSLQQLQKIAVGQEFSGKSNGHGIGLSSGRQFLKKQGGSLQVFSLEKGGSLFQVRYPLTASTTD